MEVERRGELGEERIRQLEIAVPPSCTLFLSASARPKFKFEGALLLCSFLANAQVSRTRLHPCRWTRWD